jgi:hypothetical protein
VPSTKVREIAAMLKAIHAGEDIVAARQKAEPIRINCVDCAKIVGCLSNWTSMMCRKTISMQKSGTSPCRSSVRRHQAA